MSRAAVVWAVAGLVAVVVGASFALSSAALVAVAGWAGVHGPLAACVPVLADGGALAFTLAALVRQAQGRNAHAEWVSLAVLAVVSVAANVVHAAADVVPEPLRLGVGVAVVGIAPLVVLQATHTLAGLLASLAPADVAAVAGEAAPVRFVAAPSAAVEPVEVPGEVEPVSGPQRAAERGDVAAVAGVEPGAAASGRAWSDVPLWDRGDAEDERLHVASEPPRVASPRVAPSSDDVAAMRAMRNSGASLRAIGAAFGCNASTVARRLAAAEAVAA